VIRRIPPLLRAAWSLEVGWLANTAAAALIAFAAAYLLAALAYGDEPAPMPRPAGPISPAAVVAAALEDARSLPAEVVRYTRYLDARTLQGEDAAASYGVLCYHVNGLSREAELIAPRKVTPWLWAINLQDYRYPSKVFGALREVNSYYSVPVVDAKTGEKDFLPNPLFRDLPALVALTGSQTPVVRADQFLFLTGAQVGRTGYGYYDVLELKSRADAEKLAALDRKVAEAVFREHAAIIPASGVALNNRQLFRYSTVSGAWWESRDADAGTGRANATANLLADFKHVAEEIVATLPNGLPLFYVCDDKGKQVDSVPDTVAADHGATNNDRRIHIPYSCVGCHTDGGLIPLRDYARRIYSRDTGVSLAALAVDPATARRLQSVYLGPLQRGYDRDRADYAAAIESISGLKPAELSRHYRRVWSEYLDRPVTAERAALELGVSVDQLRARFRAYAATKGVLDPVLLGLVIEDGPPVRREYFEERFATALLILQGATP
jgi:hypothetical protein